MNKNGRREGRKIEGRKEGKILEKPPKYKLPNVTSRMGLYFPLPCLLKFLLYSTQFFKLSFSAHFGAEFQSEKGGKKVEITPGTNLKGS